MFPVLLMLDWIVAVPELVVRLMVPELVVFWPKP